jgi:short-subunit dehydrogenase
MATALPASIPVLVTGASSGIGEEFARRLAERGHDVTVVARRVDRLEQLAKELTDKHGGRVEVVAADLETPRGRAAIAKMLRERFPWILVNNAGFATRGRFAELDQARERGELQLNVVTLHELSLATLPGLVAAGTGGIINVASTAAFQPLPYMATYAATKAFVLNFSEALAEEVRGSGVRVMALCPGATRTEFGDVAGVNDYMELVGGGMSTQRCVAIALRAFDRGHAICIPGAFNAVLSHGPRIAPRFGVRRIAGAIFNPR